MRLALVVSTLALLVYGLLGGASAWGAERIFSAELSLTGGCQEPPPKLDPVLDPGCPGGTHPGPFVEPRAVAVDSFGDFYVSSEGKEGGAEGRIDIFSPAGIYISGITITLPLRPTSLAIDSLGNLYVVEVSFAKAVLSRYKPIAYEPATQEIEYPATPTAAVIDGQEGSFYLGYGAGLALDPKNDDLFVDLEKHVSVYSSAAEGNKLLNATIGEGSFDTSKKIAVDGARRRLYASDAKAPTHNPDYIRVFEADPPYKLLETLDGSNTPVGRFQSLAGTQSIAVDEETGDFFVDDISSSRKVYQFNKDYEYLFTYTHGFEGLLPEIEVDNAASSPNKGTLFVPSIKEGGHAYAFKVKEVGPPVVKEPVFASEVTEDDAELHASINPEGLETKYRFEYVTQQKFEESGFTGATVAGEGTLPVGKEDVEVSAVASGLEPGTSYRFLAFAENEEGPGEDEKTFTTYEAVGPLPPCENDALRIGLSAVLPDCRAYELVTPSSTNGHVPRGIGLPGMRMLTREASPLGDKVSFVLGGGTLPGFEGSGGLLGDPYLATRGPKGWTTASAGPTGTESQSPQAGSVSADQGYSFWNTDIAENDEGSRVIEGQVTNYVRYPDGESELIGRGSLGTDPRGFGKFISEGGSHIVFQTTGADAQQLEPDAPPSGTGAVYDRTSDEVTHVVSLLPGNVTPGAGEGAEYLGASADGSGIAFEIGGVLYLRLDNAETYEVGKGLTFAGVAEDGGRIFYVEGGNLYAFDVGTKEAIPFAESGDATVVNVSADGTAAYFVSPTVLTGEEANPNGAKAQAGKENLYLSEEGSLRFVGTVTDRDVEGDVNEIGGLGLWTAVIGKGNLGKDPSRTTPDGSVLLFESQADLTGYDPEGHTEVYRYGAGELTCLSCSPTRTPASGDASLESFLAGGATESSFSVFGYVPNLRSDGSRAFFQTPEPLVLADTDGRQDVYEWEEAGVGSCEEEGGCVYLISSGASAHNDFLYAVSDSGDDVFFRTRDLLTGSDAETTTSIYDARVDGGFPEEPAEICQGEGCRPQLTPPPLLPGPATGPQGSDGNVSEPKAKPCPKGRHKVKRNGKVRCVKKHHKRKHHK